MSKSQVDIPEDLNKLLRRYVIDFDKGSREKAIIYILENVLKRVYKEVK